MVLFYTIFLTTVSVYDAMNNEKLMNLVGRHVDVRSFESRFLHRLFIQAE